MVRSLDKAEASLILNINGQIYEGRFAQEQEGLRRLLTGQQGPLAFLNYTY